MLHAPRVLVMDGQTETQEVLKTVLEPRGMQVECGTPWPSRLTAETEEPPDLVVIDAEVQRGSGETWDEVPQVIIGQARIPAAGGLATNRRYLSKPFHYAELVRVIEQLLERRTA